MQKSKRKLICDLQHDSVINTLKTFPDRYRHHATTAYQGVWQLNLLHCNRDAMFFQMIDKTFSLDCSKSKKSDASIIRLKITPLQTKTILDFSLQWPKLTGILLFCFPILWISFQAFLLFSGAFDLLFIPITLLLFALEIIVIIIRKKHDFLAIRVFENILLKNFVEYCHHSEENENHI